MRKNRLLLRLKANATTLVGLLAATTAICFLGHQRARINSLRSDLAAVKAHQITLTTQYQTLDERHTLLQAEYGSLETDLDRIEKRQLAPTIQHTSVFRLLGR